MEYQVTARKWRPQSFREIVGQDNIVTTVKNALSSGKIPHAFLFSGVRGVGKTTTARVIAKALNCPNQKDFEPCNTCPVCNEITNGYSLDVIEIDGASNRGIDNIRQIRDTVSYMPMSGKYKVYIIDEVHMLTNEASNALLKTLEEPPDHVIFILATTEPHKVLPTIKSRCQHFVFRKIPMKTIMDQLTAICKKDKITCTEEAVYQIANAADGSMRDAESIFDQAVLYSGGNITEDTVEKLIGIPDMTYFTGIVEAVRDNDPVLMLRTFNGYMETIGDIKVFCRNFIQFVKNGLLSKKLPAGDPLIDLTESKYAVVKKLFEGFTDDQLVQIINLFVGIFRDLKGDANERFLFEITLFKLLDYRNMVPLGELRNELLEMVKKGDKPASNPSAGTVKNLQVQAPKETVRVVETPTTIKHNYMPHNELDNTEIRQALEQVMGNSLVMKAMIPTIRNIHLTSDSLRVEITNVHNCEFLVNNKKDIQQELAAIVKKPLHLHFFHNDHECRPENMPDNRAMNPEKPVEAKPVAGDRIGMVKNIFEGKVIE